MVISRRSVYSSSGVHVVVVMVVMRLFVCTRACDGGGGGGGGGDGGGRECMLLQCFQNNLPPTGNQGNMKNVLAFQNLESVRTLACLAKSAFASVFFFFFADPLPTLIIATAENREVLIIIITSFNSFVCFCIVK